MARGADEKAQVIKKILEIFPGAFEYDKTIRIPIGEFEVKCTLAVAKDNVAGAASGSSSLSSSVKNEEFSFPDPVGTEVTKEPEVITATQEEKDEVAALLKEFGF